jgi:hypothetical protein
MAHTTPHALYSLLGWIVWGDLGPTTIYRSHNGKIVVYPKTWPKDPASPAQLVQRQRFVDAAAGWQALSPATRLQWETATRRASLCLNGYGLFVHWHTLQDLPAIRTLERQTHTQLVP